MGVVDYAEFRNVDMVIEVVIEKISIEARNIYSPGKDNTSTIDLNPISEKTHVQDHIVGAHFFQSCACDATPRQIIVDLINVGKNI